MGRPGPRHSRSSLWQVAARCAGHACQCWDSTTRRTWPTNITGWTWPANQAHEVGTNQTVENAPCIDVLGSACVYRRRPELSPARGRLHRAWGHTHKTRWGLACWASYSGPTPNLPPAVRVSNCSALADFREFSSFPGQLNGLTMLTLVLHRKINVVQKL